MWAQLLPRNLVPVAAAAVGNRQGFLVGKEKALGEGHPAGMATEAVLVGTEIAVAEGRPVDKDSIPAVLVVPVQAHHPNYPSPINLSHPPRNHLLSVQFRCGWEEEEIPRGLRLVDSHHGCSHRLSDAESIKN